MISAQFCDLLAPSSKSSPSTERPGLADLSEQTKIHTEVLEKKREKDRLVQGRRRRKQRSEKEKADTQRKEPGKELKQWKGRPALVTHTLAATFLRQGQVDLSDFRPA